MIKFSCDFNNSCRKYTELELVHIMEMYNLHPYLIDHKSHLRELQLLCLTHSLSEDFIEKYILSCDYDNKSYSCWTYISSVQNLSENFIRKYKDKINWIELCENDNIRLSDKFCEKFDSYIKNDKSSSRLVLWQISNEYHRTAGPAIIYNNSNIKEYWYRGKHLKDINSMEEYQHWLNLRAFR